MLPFCLEFVKLQKEGLEGFLIVKMVLTKKYSPS